MNLFKAFNSNVSQDMGMEQVARMIGHDVALKENTLLYRALLMQGNEKAAKAVKESMPLLAVSFAMEGGKGKECCRDCLYQVLLDFDAKGPEERLPAEELERVKTVMRTSYHVRLGYESISGLGYHVVVPFVLPEGIVIDMAADAKRGEEIFARAYINIAHQYAVWCGHAMDLQCKNVNRMMGLSFDAQVVCRPDARPIRLSREELGIDKDGRLVRMKTPRRAFDAEGQAVSVPLEDRLERAVKMVEECGLTFAVGNRHNFVMRVSFILNRMGVGEEEAARALDEAYLGQMDGRPSDVVHSCYRAAASEYGVWMPQRPGSVVKTEKVRSFVGKQKLRYDLLTQKTLQQKGNGRWVELRERDENDLYMACCAELGLNVSEKTFLTVLNSSTVPEVHPLRNYVRSRPEWSPEQPDFIGQAAGMVHMATAEEDALWRKVFPKWFVAMVAGWLDDEVVNHQVIVLVGRQGIYKSTWINRLLPPELKAYGTDNVDIERLDKDEQLRAAEYGLVNIDELDKLSDRQLNKLKSMITTSEVDVRAPFGRHKEKRVRVASYAASGNKEEFLTDQTGNRRWLPFHVGAIDSPFTNSMPYDGMYAQAAYLVAHGFNYWFDIEDIQALEPHVGEFMVPTSEEDLIPIYFSPATKDDPGAVFYTLAEIASKISNYGSLKREINLCRLGAILTKLGFVRERRGHDKRRGYYVREHQPQEIEQSRSPDVF